MTTSRRVYSTATIVLVSLLTLSVLLGFYNFANSTANASMDVTAVTDSSDLLQYEWSQIHGDPAFTRFSAGPAPEASDILWKTTIEGIQSYVAAFNGKVFVTTRTNVIALHKDLGNIIWNTTLPARQRWPTVYKIDDAHLVVGQYCLDPENGNILWESSDFSANTGNFAEGVYSPEEKLFYTKGESSVQAWDFSDPTKPTTLAWETFIPDSGSVGAGIQYGDGKVFPGSAAPNQIALDAKTGNVVWDTQTTGIMTWSGSYYQGRFLRGGTDNQFYCFNATNGEVLWVYNPGTEVGHWASGCATAYGMVYEINKDGHLYALDVNTGDVVWKYKCPGYIFFPGWPVVADGKVYATTGQENSTDPFTGQVSSKPEFVCLDAFTGSLLWELPIQAYAPRESTAIAYGNLYLIPGSINYMEMDSYITLNEVWAIGPKQWPIFRRDPAHTAASDSGPTNLSLRWKFTTGGAVISSPTIADSKVYVGSYDKNIYCLDALNGAFIWNYTTGAGIKSSPAMVDGKVYVGPDDGYVYCLNANNGSLIWKTYAGGYIEAHFGVISRLSSSPTVVEGRVYVGSLDKKTYCLDANSGDVIWTYETAGYISSSPAVVDGAVYITSQEPNSGTLYKLDATTSNLIWNISLPYRISEGREKDMMASPTVADGMVFASSNKLWRYGINATTGKIEWTYTNDATEFIIDTMAYHEGKLFFPDLNYIGCIDATSGQPIWTSYLGEILESSPTYADGKVYVSTSDRRIIYVLNASTGERLSWFPTGSKCWSSPSLWQGRLYVGNHDMNIYCLVDTSFPIITPSVIANLNTDMISLANIESVTVTGQIEPRIPNAPLTVIFSKPDGTSIHEHLTSNENAAFTISYTPDTAGNWTVTVRYDGAEYPSRMYTQAFSTHLPLTVVESEEPPSSPPPPPPKEGIPTEYIIVLVGAILLVVIVTFVYWYIKEGKNRHSYYTSKK
ncbi:MAG: PQQ-binding-like beta-propeller repeat protein [Candidatus Bathyarchaeum sp.]|nr:MAG: PQQ-binding-like beta-propeller repeat protein [Candidatus Bathyarchaeum sp.]